MRPTRESGNRSGDRRGEDNPAAARDFQRRQAGTDRQEGAPQIGVHHVVEIFNRHGGQLGSRKNTRIGAQDIDRAELRERRLGHRLGTFGCADVSANRGNLAAMSLQFRRDGFPVGKVAGHDHHVAANFREATGYTFAYSLAGTGDNDGAAGQ